MINTERLMIEMASAEQMAEIIHDEPDENLQIAYSEMLNGSIRNGEMRQWYVMWLIIAKCDYELVGKLCFMGEPKDGMVEIGCGIDEGYRDMGYGTEAVDAMTNWALKQEGVEYVEAETELDNIASQTMLKNCGFVPTGEIGVDGPRFRKR